VEKLRQKGMVKREICEGNRRQVDISITEKGMVLLKKTRQRRTWLAGYPEKHFQKMTRRKPEPDFRTSCGLSTPELFHPQTYP